MELVSLTSVVHSLPTDRSMESQEEGDATAVNQLHDEIIDLDAEPWLDEEELERTREHYVGEHADRQQQLRKEQAQLQDELQALCRIEIREDDDSTEESLSESTQHQITLPTEFISPQPICSLHSINDFVINIQPCSPLSKHSSYSSCTSLSSQLTEIFTAESLPSNIYHLTPNICQDVRCKMLDESLPTAPSTPIHDLGRQGLHKNESIVEDEQKYSYGGMNHSYGAQFGHFSWQGGGGQSMQTQPSLPLTGSYPSNITSSHPVVFHLPSQGAPSVTPEYPTSLQQHFADVIFAAASARQHAIANAHRDFFLLDCTIRCRMRTRSAFIVERKEIDEEDDDLEYYVQIAPASLPSITQTSSLYNPPITMRSIPPAWSPDFKTAAEHASRMARLPPLPTRAAMQQRFHSMTEQQWQSLHPHDTLSRLPNVLLIHICTFLSSPEVASGMTPLSQRWKRLSTNKKLWLYLCTRTYHLPQRALDAKAYFASRLLEDRRRCQGVDAIPSPSALAEELKKCAKLKAAIRAVNSGTSGLIQCICWMAFIIMLLMKLGNFFPRSSSAGSPNGSEDYKWSLIFLPLWISHLLVDASLISFVILALRPNWYRCYYRDIHGLVSWSVDWISSDPLFSWSGDDRRSLAHGGAGWPYGFHLSHIIILAGGIFLPFQLATLFACVKLSWNTSCACEDRTFLWRDITWIFLIPAFFILMYVLRAQIHQWRSSFIAEEDRCPSICCCFPSIPQRSWMISFLETSGFVITAIMVAMSVDSFRNDALNMGGVLPATQPYYTSSHWAFYCFLPMYLGHLASIGYVQFWFFVYDYRHIFWGFHLAQIIFRVFVRVLADIIMNLLIRSVLICMEIMAMWNLAHEFERMRDAIELASSSTTGSPTVTKISVAPVINDGYVVIPLIISLGIMILCIYVPVSFAEIHQRRRERRLF